MSTTVWFILLCAAFFAVMVVIRAISNAAEASADRRRDERDRRAGAYQVSRPENLADRYKKEK